MFGQREKSMTDDILAQDGGQGNDDTGAGGKGGDGGDGNGGTPNEFVGGLPEDLRGHEALKDVDSAESLTKRVVELHGKQAPSAPEAYDFTIPDGQKEPMPVVKAFAEEAAKDLGLSQEGFAKTEKWITGYVGKLIEADKANHTKALEEAQAELKKDWGDKYDANVGNAVKFATKLELIEPLTKLGLQNDPHIVKAFSRAFSMISEDQFESGGGGGGGGEMSPGQAMGFDKIGAKK